MQINVKLSLELSRQIRAQPQACYRNSIMVQAILGEEAVYVEGFAVWIESVPVPLEHGWLEYRGEIIEVTPGWLNFEERRLYFPGLRYTYDEVQRRIHSRRTQTLLPFHGGMGVSYPSFRQAMIDAYKAGFGEEAGEKIAMMLDRTTIGSA